MLRYYLRLVKDDEIVRMPQGMDLPGPAAAREAALAFARDLIRPIRKEILVKEILVKKIWAWQV